MMSSHADAMLVQEFVELRIRHELLDLRKSELEALKRGFDAIPIMKHLRLFTAFELMGLLQVPRLEIASQCQLMVLFLHEPLCAFHDYVLRSSLNG